MKYLLLATIMMYQAFFPKRFRGRCLFKESCSNYVYNRTKYYGLREGVKAFFHRYKNCRAGYKIFRNEDEVLFINATNEIVSKKEIKEQYFR